MKKTNVSGCIGRLTSTLAAMLLLVSACNAQWVMVARAVSGRVQQMSHKPDSGGGGYDVATVVLEAPAQKVYTTALAALKTHAGISVTGSDDKKREIQFTNGVQYASLPDGTNYAQQTVLDAKATQMQVTTSNSNYARRAQ